MSRLKTHNRRAGRRRWADCQPTYRMMRPRYAQLTFEPRMILAPLPYDDAISPEIQAFFHDARSEVLDHMSLLDRVAMMDLAWPPAWPDWPAPEIKYTPRDPRGVWGGFIRFHKVAR